MSDKKATPDERTPVHHITALLEQVREVVRKAGVIISTHTADTPADVASASLEEIRADPKLWAAYNRGREDRIREQVTRSSPEAFPSTNVTPRPGPVQTVRPGANTHPESTEYSDLVGLRQQEAREGHLRHPRPWQSPTLPRSLPSPHPSTPAERATPNPGSDAQASAPIQPLKTGRRRLKDVEWYHTFREKRRRQKCERVS